MVKNHLKRLAVPSTWNIKKKENKFISRPAPGGHKIDHSVPLIVLFRDMLGKAKTVREMKYILQNKEILLNGKRQKDHKAPVGLMDVISIPDTKSSYRILLSPNGKLNAVKIDAAESAMLLCKIRSKTMLKGGKVQVNFTNGWNLIVDKGEYKTGEVLVIDIIKNKVQDQLKLEKGAVIYLVGGRHAGIVGKVESVEARKLAFMTDKQVFETLKDYAFIIGKDKPIIKMND